MLPESSATNFPTNLRVDLRVVVEARSERTLATDGGTNRGLAAHRGNQTPEYVDGVHKSISVKT